MPRGLYFFKREGEWPVILSAIMNTSTTCLWWPGGFSPIWKILCWCIGFRECCWHLQDVCRKWLNYDIEKWSRVIRMQTGLVVRKAISIWLCFYEWSLSFSCCFKDLLGFGGALFLFVFFWTTFVNVCTEELNGLSEVLLNEFPICKLLVSDPFWKMGWQETHPN